MRPLRRKHKRVNAIADFARSRILLLTMPFSQRMRSRPVRDDLAHAQVVNSAAREQRGQLRRRIAEVSDGVWATIFAAMSARPVTFAERGLEA